MEEEVNNYSFIKNKDEAEEVDFKIKGETEKRGFFSSFVDNFKDGETRLNVSGHKVYDDNLNEKYIPEVEVNTDSQKIVKDDVNVVDVPFNSPDGNVYDKDDETRKKAASIVDDVFDDMLNKSSRMDYSNLDVDESNKESFNQFNETSIQNEPVNNSKPISEDDFLKDDDKFSDEFVDGEDIIKRRDDEEPTAEDTKIIDYKTADNIAVSSSTELYDRSIFDIADIVKGIVEVEGPVHVNELIKRIRESCEIKRAGAKFKKTINDAIEISEQSGDITKVDEFLFNDLDKNINIRKRNKPNIDLIAPAEIEKNIELILTENKSLDISNIAKKAASNFGFKSTSKKTADRINSVLDLMIVDGRVIVKDDVVELN